MFCCDFIIKNRGLPSFKGSKNGGTIIPVKYGFFNWRQILKKKV